MGFYVKRVRLPDTEGIYHQEPGAIRFSKTFPTARAAEREAEAWRSTGDWSAEVLEGRAPANPPKAKPTEIRFQ